MDNNFPEIRIERRWLLEEPAVHIAKFLDPLLVEHQRHFPADKMAERVREYRIAWARYGGWMMRGMCDVLGLRFRHNIVDVHIVSFWTTAMSFPLIVPARYSPEQFPHTLTHELLHVLLTDNVQNVDTKKILDKMLPAEMTSSCTRKHVMVQAAHKFLLLETIVRPDILKHEIDRCDKFPDYRAGWEYVERIGYQNLITQYRELAGLGPPPL